MFQVCQVRFLVTQKAELGPMATYKDKDHISVRKKVQTAMSIHY